MLHLFTLCGATMAAMAATALTLLGLPAASAQGSACAAMAELESFCGRARRANVLANCILCVRSHRQFHDCGDTVIDSFCAAPPPRSSSCAAHCKTLGCIAGGGAACKSCVANHRHDLQGECWDSPCPSHKCFSQFERGYCGSAPSPTPPSPPTPPGNGRSFYVAAEGGSDTNTGASFAQAFATVRHCLTAVASNGGGGTCWLGPGRHFANETAVATSAATVSGAKSGARPAILDGSVSLDVSWSHLPAAGSSCVYRSSPLPSPVSQLWVSTAGPNAYGPEGYDVLTPARFPNAKMSDDSVFQAAPGAHSSLLYSTRASTPDHLIEDGTHVPSMASSGLDFTGTIAVMPLGVMGDETQGVRVAKYQVGNSSFNYVYPKDTKRELHMNNAFFFEGSCKLLDSEGEWCYDAPTRSIHIWLDNCADPSHLTFRGKVREYLINGTQLPSPGLRIEKLTMWGGTFAVLRSNLTLDTVDLLFPTANRRVLGEAGMLRANTLLMNNPAHGHFTMINSTLEWADGTVPLNLIGNGAVFRNNLFRRNGYAIGDGASISDGGNSDGMLFERNTIALFNSFSGITPGLHSTIRLNEFWGQGTDADGACVHVHIKQQNGILIERNWAHDSTVKGFRFDRVNKANATWGVNGTFVENVVWNCASSCFKGDYHNISRNTVIEVSTGGSTADGSKTPALYVLEYDPALSWTIPGENSHTYLDSNAADSIFNVSIKGVLTLPGIHRNNVAGIPIVPMLVDPSARNFRPKGGSAIYSLGAGAYDNGSESEYWIPGRQSHEATHPIPPHQGHAAHAIESAEDDTVQLVELIWRGGYKARAHRLTAVLQHIETVAETKTATFDADKDMVVADTEADATQYMLRLPRPDPSSSDERVRRRVLWRVDAVGEGDDVRRGPVWSFTL